MQIAAAFARHSARVLMKAVRGSGDRKYCPVSFSVSAPVAITSASRLIQITRRLYFTVAMGRRVIQIKRRKNFLNHGLDYYYRNVSKVEVFFNFGYKLAPDDNHT